MERWEDIKGYDGLYQISTKGNVRSLDRFVKYSSTSSKFQKGRILKPSLKRGYKVVCLSKNSVQKYFLIHRLIAMSFIPRVENKFFINHKDGVKTNNELSNLEWVTLSENSNHAYALGLNHKGSNHYKSTLTDIEVSSIKKIDYSLITKVRVGKIYGVLDTTIHNILSNRNWSHI